ncbi:hypothetical protein ACIRSU_22795 [Streptomyces sp. NPDC101160]|uniref:hypothetical protein n=1 Tax=Streptomyces sp. NPDC101160 TaxID=3366118 RepID=UPI00382D734E
MAEITTGALEQLEELVKALREGSESKVREALTRAATNPDPGGQAVEVERLIVAAAPNGLAGLVDGGKKVAGGAADALRGATKPLGVWEAESPEIVMSGLGNLLNRAAKAVYDGVKSVVTSVASTATPPAKKVGQYDSGYDPSHDAQN